MEYLNDFYVISEVLSLWVSKLNNKAIIQSIFQRQYFKNFFQKYQNNAHNIMDKLQDKTQNRGDQNYTIVPKTQQDFDQQQQSSQIPSVYAKQQKQIVRRRVFKIAEKYKKHIALKIIKIVLFQLGFCILVDLTFLLNLIIFAFVIFLVFFVKLQVKKKTNKSIKLRLRNKFQIIFGLIILIVNLIIYFSIKSYELQKKALVYQYTVPNFANQFYRINDPFLNYNPDLLFFQEKFNIYQQLKNNQSKSIKTVQNVQIKQINVWSSDPMRYDFLLQYWSSLNQQSAQKSADYVCIAESDFVFDITFFADEIEKLLREESFSIVHVQNYWRKQTMQKYSIGMVCTHRNPTLYTKLWMRMSRFLHERRYRRLIPEGILYWILPNRHVFQWQEYGCNSFDKHCKYIHYMSPKLFLIRKDLKTIQSLIQEMNK